MKTTQLTDAEAFTVAKELQIRAEDARGFGLEKRAERLEKLAGRFD